MKQMTEENTQALGIDIGGSHITAGLVDLKAKRIKQGSVVRQRVNRHAPESEILEIWAGAITELMQRFPRQFNRVGFAMPGPFDYEEGICLIKGFDKYEALYGMSIRNEMASRTGLFPEDISFCNDADAFLEGEMYCGAGQGYNRTVGITLGTGLGSCFYNQGDVSDACLNVLSFKEGKAEDYISSRWFEREYELRSGEKLSSVKYLEERYPEDALAKEIMDEFSGNLAAVLLHSIRQFTPQAVIIGGNISKAFHLFSGPVRQFLKGKGVETVLLQSSLGEHAALIGAAISFEIKLV